MIKNKAYSSLPFIFIYSCLLSISCCKPDDDPCKGTPSQTYTYNISDLNKQKIPFSSSGNETLVFVDSSDLIDTAKLIGQGKVVYFDTYSKYSNDNPDCGNQDFMNFENIKFTFTGNNPDLNNIDYHIYLRFAGADYIPPNKPDGNDYLSITCNNQTAKNTFTYANRDANYTDSVNINGVYYSGAIIKEGILYSYHYGILRIQLNGKTWLKAF
jgi:hypothetical protein